MREFTTPAVYQVPAEASLSDFVWRNAAEAPDQTVIMRGGQSQPQRQLIPLTTTEFRDAVAAVAKGLIAAGVQPGDRVGLMSRTRFEWALFDFAILTIGAVTVPVYETSSAEQIRWILSDSGAVAVIVETAENEALVAQVHAELLLLKHVWQIDAEASAEQTLAAAGAAVSDADLAARRTAVRPDDLATIIYTSGTTGRPKGCVLTHRNFLAGVGNVRVAFEEQLGGGSTLVFVSLAHVLGREIQIVMIAARVLMAFCPDPKKLREAVAEFPPTIMLAVPRVFEKLYNGAAQKARSEGKGKIFDSATKTAIDYSKALDSGGPGLGLRLRHAVFNRLVYKKVRAVLGGQCTTVISGGAPLGLRLAHYFRGVGIDVYEGYGLTETTAAAVLNRPDKQRLGTVGPPIPGISVRIADDGEIEIHGDIVTPEYWGDAAATAAAIDSDGWLHTGDLGSLDDGFLRITGRKKEILVTSGGKNVAPAPLEDRLRAHPLISQCMVVGDGEHFIACLVTLDMEALPPWLAEHNKAADLSLAQLRDDPDIRATIQQAVTEANATVSRAESIRVFEILDDDFTVENELLTPSLKVKRAQIARAYATVIADIYANSDATDANAHR